MSDHLTDDDLRNLWRKRRELFAQWQEADEAARLAHHVWEPDPSVPACPATGHGRVLGGGVPEPSDDAARHGVRRLGEVAG